MLHNGAHCARGRMEEAEHTCLRAMVRRKACQAPYAALILIVRSRGLSSW